MEPRVISSQRFLNPEIVQRKAEQFRVFVVRTLDIDLRGRRYRVMLDGHHNLAAARLAGIAPTWKGPSRKTRRVIEQMGTEAFACMLINNLTDSDWYDVISGQIVDELLGVERSQ